ncbi:FecR family protein [Membranihabitans maritimus]|uniref:FecR family protein n=1 Tax=Membranihabitans maritimus TaxID=2904244 RepID=UPI001F32BF8D|nr:FecR domain-containing protein [Membranihabitans maritimus]
MQNKEYIKNIIDKYLLGEASEEEIAFLDSYYKYFDKNNNVLEEFTKEEQSELEIRIKKRIKSGLKRKNRSRIPIGMKIAGVAAAIAILVATVFLGRDNENPINEVSPENQVAVVHEILITSEKMENIYLPDGSIVYMNEGSKLRYPSEFDSSGREVFLEGEGYFDVKHDPERPFIVRSGNISTRVLGTAFNVRALPDEDEIKVTVTRGKVQVLEDKKELGVITPDQQIAYNKDSKEFTQMDLNPKKEAVAWKPVEYSLSNLSMSEVAGFISKRWDRKIEFASQEIEGCYLSATFFEEDSLEELLNVVCTVVNAKYKFENQKIIIYGIGCK